MCKTFAGKRYTNSTGKQNWANRSVNQADLIQQYANIVTVLLFCVNPFFGGGGAPHATALLYQTRERERECFMQYVKKQGECFITGSRRLSAFMVSRCLEPLMKNEARVFDTASQTCVGIKQNCLRTIVGYKGALSGRLFVWYSIGK